MVHCNNFTSDINEWAGLFAELAKVMGTKINMEELFTLLFKQAMKADVDVGELVSCNYYSGEPITGFEAGRPLLVRMPDSRLTLPNFMRTQIYSALATLEIGMEILTTKEKVQVDYILGHGGFFKTENVGQQLMADALRIPISIMNTAAEGGPWGMALLAAYSVNKKVDQPLEEYLENEVFATERMKTLEPTEEGMDSFIQYMKRYKSMLKVERAAVDSLR
jgi:sugar (pentulose or hexulose) kinase